MDTPLDPALVPERVPSSLDCETIGTLVPELVDGLYLNGTAIQESNQVSCAWSDVRLDTLSPRLQGLSTELDVVIRVLLDDRADSEYLEWYCQQPDVGTTALGEEVFGEADACAGGSFPPSDGTGVWALIPFFDLDVAISCDLSTACTPNTPASMTDELGMTSLRAIADVLPAMVPDGGVPGDPASFDSPRDLVVAWAKAGFPTSVDEPSWFCEGWAEADDGLASWMQGSVSENGWSYAIDDSNGSVTLSLQGPGDGEYADYDVAAEDSCIGSLTALGA